MVRLFIVLAVLVGMGVAGAVLLLRSSPLLTAQAAPGAAKVYGEWHIRVKPDKGAEYARLIQEKGLPLFREAGGRMVGWWTTLVGDLYEHVTIWEYDGLPAFEKAVQFLGKDERFQKFTEIRDPLLTGEDCRFLKGFGPLESPALPERARVVVQEVHKVRLERFEAYAKGMSETLPALRKQGLRCAGPFHATLGSWTEVSFLWFYDSLAEREAKVSAPHGAPDMARHDKLIFETVGEVTTRLLLPAPFAY